jgi:ferredoxin
MRVHIDQDKCCGAGQCVMAAPEVFDQREDDGIVVLLNGEPADDQLEPVREAIRICPALAIKLEI